jgi:hypothetical protein
MWLWYLSVRGHGAAADQVQVVEESSSTSRKPRDTPLSRTESIALFVVAALSQMAVTTAAASALLMGKRLPSPSGS